MRSGSPATAVVGFVCYSTAVEAEVIPRIGVYTYTQQQKNKKKVERCCVCTQLAARSHEGTNLIISFSEKGKTLPPYSPLIARRRWLAAVKSTRREIYLRPQDERDGSRKRQ